MLYTSFEGIETNLQLCFISLGKVKPLCNKRSKDHTPRRLRRFRLKFNGIGRRGFKIRLRLVCVA